MADDWFKNAFDDFYLSLYAHRNQQDARNAMQFLLRERIVREDEMGLDLCCGPGRHLIELCREKMDVVGLDLSAPLLAEAAQKLSAANLPAPLVQGSMERLPFRPAAFRWVVNLFTSFGYFEHDADNARVIREVARVLQPGGRFLMDFLNAPNVRATLVKQSRETRENGAALHIRRAIEGTPPRVVKRVRVVSGTEEREIVKSVRLFEREELQAMFAAAGLKVRQIWGDFAGKAWSEKSPRCILLAGK